ncbi:uncharacterized protein L203_105948 [Cryptococcus depauperatus CBS 7841]|uniref:EKC/KEOPS complex subunit CGI121 n=1 Tax=Cryptococcus depauperatus CBS 7841 TaxID=1295531 RepID=A0A1E3IUZ5_9TREE|nr:protein CGI121 [Cryptococcus depauperatus CBS 7841]
METFTFESFPAVHSVIHIALFENVSNSAAIRKRLVAASQMGGAEGDAAKEEVDYGFVEAQLLVSKEHLLSAMLATLLYAYPSTEPSPAEPSSPNSVALSSLSVSERTPRTRSHNLHSEVLLLLSPNNNITDSIKRHGISDNTTSLAVVKFGSAEKTPEEVFRGMESVVDGKLVSWNNLETGTDWAMVDKIYKLSELNALKLGSSELLNKKKTAVVSCVAVKNVI